MVVLSNDCANIITLKKKSLFLVIANIARIIFVVITF